MPKIISLMLCGKNDYRKNISLVVENRPAKSSSCPQSSRDFLRDLFEKIGVKKFSEITFHEELKKNKFDWFSILIKYQIINIQVENETPQNYRPQGALFTSSTAEIIFTNNELFLTHHVGNNQIFHSVKSLELSFNYNAPLFGTEKVLVDTAWTEFLKHISISNVSVIFNDFLLEFKVLADEKEKRRRADETFEESPYKFIKSDSSSEINDFLDVMDDKLVKDIFYNDHSNSSFLLFEQSEILDLWQDPEIEKLLLLDSSTSQEDQVHAISPSF